MIKEAIILAGGLGTRLRETLPDLPKCMAPIEGRPFLFYLINYLRSQGIEKFIFALGYKAEIICAYLSDQFPTLSYDYVIEHEPMGTGGAVRLAMAKTSGQTVAICNGDTLFNADLQEAYKFHIENNAHCTLILKPMLEFDRYGVVEMDELDRISAFKEKQYTPSGNINGGIYLLEKAAFSAKELPQKCSFEKDFLESFFHENKFYGHLQDAYFIDIGIPEDYRRAQEDLSSAKLDLTRIDDSWAIFIDRDGVINPEKKNDYIRNKEEFSFFHGVPEAMSIIANRFGKIIIVTNQRGIGKKLMTEADLEEIHEEMEMGISAAGGRIDRIYYCTATDDKAPCRKPNPGMAFQANKDFPSLDLRKSVMIGNKLSDMQFGKNAGMYTVFVATTHPEVPYPHPDIDLRMDSLPAFAQAL